MNKSRHGFQAFPATVVEMTDDRDARDELVNVDPALLEKVSEGDDKPQFVTINVAVEGVSKSGRNWTRELIHSIAEQINTKHPDGYSGHVADADRPFKRPDPQTIWLGATVVEKNGKAHLYAKGYVLPEAVSLRSYLRRAKAIGKNVSVSVFGKAKAAVWNAKQSAYDLKDFVLESVDWSRSGAEGIPNDGTLVLASEMHNDNKEDLNVERKDVIKSLKADELKEHNPNLVSEIQSESADEALVSEMDGIKAVVGETDKPSEAVSEMAKENRELKLDRELDRSVRSEAARALIRPLVVSEMEKAEGSVDVSEMVSGVLGSDEGKAIIEQHVDRAPKVDPRKADEAVAERKHTRIVKRNK